MFLKSSMRFGKCSTYSKSQLYKVYKCSRLLTIQHMNNNSEKNEKDLQPLFSINSALKPMLLLFCSWVFAYLLGVSIHEIGHAIASVLLGYTNIRIYLHPFELNYVTSTLSSSSLL